MLKDVLYSIEMVARSYPSVTGDEQTYFVLPPGAKPGEIQQIEAKSGLAPHPDLVELLARWNGALLFGRRAAGATADCPYAGLRLCDVATVSGAVRDMGDRDGHVFAMDHACSTEFVVDPDTGHVYMHPETSGEYTPLCDSIAVMLSRYLDNPAEPFYQHTR